MLLRGNSTDIRLLVDEFRPPLEHAGPMFQIDSSVIGTANLIMIGVGQLCFNLVRLEHGDGPYGRGGAHGRARGNADRQERTALS
jgi:hypothetical protein